MPRNGITELHGSSIFIMKNLHTIVCSGCTDLHSYQQYINVSLFPHHCQHLLEWLLTRMRWLDGITNSIEMSWASSGRWWRTEKLGVLQSMGLQRVVPNWVTEHQPKRDNRCEWYCIVILIFPPMINDVECLFMYLMPISTSSLEKISAHFKIWLLGLFYWVACILYVFWILTLYQTHDLQIFSAISVSCLFILLMASLAVQKLFSLI